MGMKRGREGRGQAKKAPKKQKLQKDSIDATSEPDSKGDIDIEDLNWQSVELPDRLGDASGFFGLEEIEGVEIIRPKSTGQIKFKVGSDLFDNTYDLGCILSCLFFLLVRSQKINPRNRY